MMGMENGMVIGAMPYNQSDAPAKASKWPNARLVIVGKEWVESEHEWEEMNHEIE